MYEVIFFDIEKYIYSESLFNTRYIEIKHRLYKNLFQKKIKVTKNAPLFLYRALAHHSFTFNSQFLYELKHKVRLSKTVYGIPFRLVFVKVYIFVQQKAWTL